MKDKKKSTFMSILTVVGISSGISAVTIGIGLLLLFFHSNSSYFLLCILAVLFSAWYGGLRTGLTTTVFTSASIVYFFLAQDTISPANRLSSFIDLLFFFLVSILLNIVIDKIRNTRDILGYKQREKEYFTLLTQMQKDNEKYRKEVKARDEFLSIASHELKTPLSAMLLQIQTALYNIRSVSLANFSVENLLRMLQSTEQQSKRLSKMINDLLNVSLITTGKLELEKEEVDLAQLTKDVVDRFMERAEREGSQITLKAAEKVVGEWDKLRIEQAVTNLISNALKYGNSKPIDIQVAKHDGMGKIAVTDHGIGIPENQQERIFERFERAVSSHAYKGLGVGLYITHQIVKTHNGKIKLASREGDGSTFVIELPLNQSAK